MNESALVVAGLALIAYLVSFVLVLAPAAAQADVGATDDQGRLPVHFKLTPPPGTKRVQVAGDWNGWSDGDASWALSDPDGDGVFEGQFKLPAGARAYKFVVDGSWQPDPDHARRQPDGHGGENSLLTGGEAARPQTGGAEPAGGDPFGSTKVRPQAFEGEVFLLDPTTQKLPDLDQLTPTGKVWADVLDIAPRAFDEGFPGLTDRFEWFALRYRGTFEAEKAGEYRFKLISDDGSKLYIDGHLAIDNDGLHEPKEVVQRVQLKKGPHDLTLEYMQGPARHVALRLLVMKPGSTAEEPVRVSAPRPRAAQPKDGRR